VAAKQSGAPVKARPPKRGATQDEGQIDGLIHTDEGAPVVGAVVTVYSEDPLTPKELATVRTDRKGAFHISLKGEEHPSGDVRVAVRDSAGRALITGDDTIFHVDGVRVGIDLSVPVELVPKSGRQRPLIQVGPMLADARIVAEATPDLVYDVANALLGGEISSAGRKRVNQLFPGINLVDRRVEPLCYTSILESLAAVIKLKGFTRDVELNVDALLRMERSAFTTATHLCPNFEITYDTAQVNSDTSAATVNDPGSNPAVPIGNLPAGGAPTYIKRVCFWLERALAAYINPPFSMLNPAAGGRIPVIINTAPYGGATPSAFYLNNALNDDLMCAVAVHELFHMVQYEYGGSGTWRQSVFEGGAVFAEDTAADLMNRYLDEAGNNFNGIGVMSNTNLSLDTASYKASLFWRYISEQQSGDITEPYIGVETYRRIIELGSAGSYNVNDVKQAIRELPWHQDFYEFWYLDPARLDRTSSETTLGNYALACRLKDLGANVPDRRFDFIEDEENIYIDEVVGGPGQSTLASVTLAGSSTVTPSASAVWSGTVNKFAHRYYEVMVDPAVTNVQVNFTAGAGLTSRLFQIALIDNNGVVRDIHRTDAATYAKRITSDQMGVKLSKLVMVVTGADSSGSFSLSASAAAAAPDVMVTRWHSAMKTEYEIDSIGWGWTWVSPDIWVDNDNNGVADSVVYFGIDNKLHIRLHNKGNAAASGISVQFWYQDAAPGLSDAAWLPVQNTGGVTQVLTGLNLGAGASSDFTVDWAPVPSGLSEHFCIRAVVSVPGDPNTDNKRVLSNFGNVQAPFGQRIDITLIRRNIIDWIGPVTMRVIPRLTPDLKVEPRDLTRLEVIDLKPGEISIDTLGITHREVKAVGGVAIDHHEGQVRLRNAPDPRRFYPADARTLPPGIEGRPMLTVVHEVDGLALGGFTYLVTVVEDERKETDKPKLKGRATTRRGATRTGSSPRTSARSSARAG
jgi:hypothetical protein